MLHSAKNDFWFLPIRLSDMSTSLDPSHQNRPDEVAEDLSTDGEIFRGGMHVFTAVLLLFAVASSFQMTLFNAGINLFFITVFAGIYFLGSMHVDEYSESKRHVWMLTLTAAWIAVMAITPVGVYLVFTLFFVYLEIFDELRGVVSVVFATAVAIIMQIPNGLTLGGIMGPAVSALISIAIFYAFRTVGRISAERQHLIDQLMETQEELALSQHEAGVVAERQRLAHEIHDTVAQGLSSIQMLLHAAEREINADNPQEAIQRIQQARSASSENLSEARAMIAALQPPSLAEEKNLHSALVRLAESFGAAGEVLIDVSSEGDASHLPMRVEAALLRIAQGAVGNVVKHSGATKCRITVTYEPEEIRLDVVDNGKGFDPDSIPKDRTELGHVGLAAMRRRADELGGELTIESAPGGPTAVSAVFQLES